MNRPEMKVNAFLCEQFAQAYPVGTYAPFRSCGDNRKPDAVVVVGDLLAVVETDEDCPAEYELSCEWAKALQHGQSALMTDGVKRVAFVRFNPSTWKVGGVAVQCDMTSRLEELGGLIEHLAETQTDLFTLHKVFYPCESQDEKWCAVSRDEIDDPRGNLITSTDPFLTRNSPTGWHSDGTTTYTESQGNNAYVYYGPDKKLASGGPDNVYTEVYDFTKPANDVNNIKAGITNNFVITNLMHDLGVAYGFTEEAGNFQKVNLGGGGKGGDAVQVSVQDAGGFDNANFATPPDGQKPKMNMYVFRGTPTRDGTMENDIVEHEYGHGISNRLTGGPANSNCLRTAEAGGISLEKRQMPYFSSVTAKPGSTPI
ncbi:hypothetical protein HDU86_005390 [Geranomyces michiganensis]|nr:hypothetical protein HDU86_005390 [Geranomyces michiganensis]